jgi:acetyltransferase-like isoleucine patch superfamily enzyme
LWYVIFKLLFNLTKNRVILKGIQGDTMPIKRITKPEDNSSGIMELFQKFNPIHKSKPLLEDIRGDNNIIENHDSSLRTVRFEVWGNNNTIIIRENCVLNDVIFHIEGDNHYIEIGAEVAFNIAGSIWFEDNDCTLTIGKRSTFENVHLAVTEPGSTLAIGEDCMFSYDIDVRTGDSHSVIQQDGNVRTNYAENISFGDHVWVASHCVILKGSRIGSDSIVGTRSVVTKSFPQEGVVVAGNPAKIIKRDIMWKRERVYDSSKS